VIPRIAHPYDTASIPVVDVSPLRVKTRFRDAVTIALLLTCPRMCGDNGSVHQAAQKGADLLNVLYHTPDPG